MKITPTPILRRTFLRVLDVLDKTYGCKLKPYQATEIFIRHLFKDDNRFKKEFSKQDLIDLGYFIRVAEKRYFKFKKPLWEKPHTKEAKRS